MRLPLLILALALCAAALPADEAPVSPLKPDETVWLFPTVGALAPEGEVWRIPVHVWVCEEELDSPVRAATLTGIQVSLRLDEGTAASQIFRQRARWFIVDNERGKELVVRLGGHLHTLPPTDAAGHSQTVLPLPVQDGQRLWRAGETVPLEIVFPEGANRVVRTDVLLAPVKGLSVISDIDDTLKITEVTDHGALLKRTFTMPFEAVPGMVERLTAWQAQGAIFHYVSASPWQLYPELSAFFAASSFPAGTWHLKQVRLKDRTLASLWDDPEETKREAILPLLAAYRGRQFILLGDAGEHDPEIYGSIARAHPAQISHIYIRLLPGREEPPLRWAQAFAGLPADRWTLLP